jgi:hypothetical protein
MGMPTPKDLHVDALLTNMSIGAKNTSYIADQIFPVLPVQKQSDIVPNYDRSHWFRNTAKLRDVGTKSVRGGFSVKATDTYFCKKYSFGFEIPDEVRANADAPWNPDREAVEFVSDKCQMAREVQFATDFFTTSVWGSDKTGAAAASSTEFIYWDTYATSSPLTDIDTYKDAVEANGIGVEPNVLVLGKQVWLKLKWHPDLVDAIKYTQRAQVTEDIFASLAAFDKVLIGRSIYTTSPEVSYGGVYGTTLAGTDQETLISYSRVWGKNGLMAYVPARPSLMQPAAGYTFVWQQVPNAIQWIKRMRDEERNVDIIEANTCFDQKATLAGAGLFLSGAVQ